MAGHSCCTPIVLGAGVLCGAVRIPVRLCIGGPLQGTRTVGRPMWRRSSRLLLFCYCRRGCDACRCECRPAGPVVALTPELGERFRHCSVELCCCGHVFGSLSVGARRWQVVATLDFRAGFRARIMLPGQRRALFDGGAVPRPGYPWRGVSVPSRGPALLARCSFRSRINFEGAAPSSMQRVALHQSFLGVVQWHSQGSTLLHCGGQA